MTVEFRRLAQLLEHDEKKVRRVVLEFYRSSVQDLHHLEQAAAARQWQTVRDIAHRLHVNFLHVGEPDAAAAAAALASIPGEFFASTYHRKQAVLQGPLDRARQLLIGPAGGREA
jgi:hypothetical protein